MSQNKSLFSVITNKLFKGIGQETLKIILHQNNYFELNEGDIVYKNGDASDVVFLIAEGEIKIKIPQVSGTSIIARKEKDDFFGEKEFIEKSLRKSSAVANTGCILYKLNRKEIAELISKNKNIRKNLIGFDDSLDTDELERQNNISEEALIEAPEFSIENELVFQENVIQSEEIVTDILTEQPVEATSENKFNDTNQDLNSSNKDTDLSAENIEQVVVADNTASDGNNNEDETIDYSVEETPMIDDSVPNFEDIRKHELERPPIINKLSNFIIEDIKTSLLISKHYAEFIEKKESSDEIKLVSGYMINQLDSILSFFSIISDFINNNRTLNTEVRSTSDFLNETLEMLAEYVEAHNIKLFKRYDFDAAIAVDKTKLYHAFYQLTKMACLTMPEGGGIYIVTSNDEDNTITISFKDSGNNTFANGHDKIFATYSELENSVTGSLELSLARKIIEDHKGTLELKGSNSEGTEFIIKIPVSLPEIKE